MNINITTHHRVSCDGEFCSSLLAVAASLLKGIHTMTTEFDTIKAHLDAAKVSSDANNAKLAELIALTDGLKTKLDAAIAAGAAMTAAEVQALSDQIVQLATSDDAAKAAAEAAILAHTPAA